MQDKMLNLLKLKTIDKNGQPVVPFFFCREVAMECGVTPREVEIFALKNGICPSRYERSIGTFGMKGQMRLLESRVAVVGCGGLGGWIIEMLARAGVGEMVIVDGDVFDDNNLNRQLFSSEENIGVLKAEAAADRVRRINSVVSVYPNSAYINKKNGIEILKGCSLVVDALDNNSGRKEVLWLCREIGIPFVHGAIAGFWGQVGVYYPDDRPFWENEDVPEKGVEVETGNPPFTPAFIGALQVAETLKILAALECPMSKTLLWFDLNLQEMQKIKI